MVKYDVLNLKNLQIYGLEKVIPWINYSPRNKRVI